MWRWKALLQLFPTPYRLTAQKLRGDEWKACKSDYASARLISRLIGCDDLWWGGDETPQGGRHAIVNGVEAAEVGKGFVEAERLMVEECAHIARELNTLLCEGQDTMVSAHGGIGTQWGRPSTGSMG